MRAPRSNVLEGPFRRDLRSRRSLQLELPEFVLCALEARMAEANGDAPPDDQCTVDEYIESELVNLITVRDVAELGMRHPEFCGGGAEMACSIAERGVSDRVVVPRFLGRLRESTPCGPGVRSARKTDDARCCTSILS